MSILRNNKVSKIIFYAIAFVVIPLVYYSALQSTPIESQWFYNTWMPGIGTTVAVLLMPAFTAGSITLERKKQTWDALLLPRLTGAQTVVGTSEASPTALRR